MQSITVLTDEMKAYFEKCKTSAVNKDLKPHERLTASEGGLCIALGITRDELRAMESGTEEERRFFGQYQSEFEVAIDAMYAARKLPDTLYKEIKSSFGKSNTSDERNITIMFPDWNAPDDWEDYKALRKVLDDNGLTWKQGVAIIAKAIKEAGLA